MPNWDEILTLNVDWYVHLAERYRQRATRARAMGRLETATALDVLADEAETAADREADAVIALSPE